MTTSTMERAEVNISIAGEWSRVPAITVDDTVIAITGTRLKMAVIHDEDCRENEIADPESCVRSLKADRANRADIFSFTQKPTSTVAKYGYRSEPESVAVVRTGNFEAWWNSLPQESRKNVRRAEKRGVTTVIKKLDDALIRDIVEVNNDSPLRQGKPFVHYGKTFEQVKFDQLPYEDRSDYVCCYFGEELIGFMKIVYRGEAASIVQVLPKASHQDKRPANALIAGAVKLCESKGVAFLTYGLFNYSNKRDSSLRDFKIRNGFNEMLVPRYYIPLTTWGRICLGLNLHRGILGTLPEWFIKTAIAVRTKWYSVMRSPKAGVAQ